MGCCCGGKVTRTGGEVLQEAQAVRQFRQVALQGVALAQEALGEMYATGQGIPQNYAEAVKWYRLAAAQGDANAQTSLGLIYGFGHGVPKDYCDASPTLRSFHDPPAAPCDTADGRRHPAK